MSVLEAVAAKDAVRSAITVYREAALGEISLRNQWNAEERKRHLMRVELSQQERAKGKSQKDADELASTHPLYQEKLLDLDQLRDDLAIAEVEARIRSYEVLAAIATLNAVAVIGGVSA